MKYLQALLEEIPNIALAIVIVLMTMCFVVLVTSCGGDTQEERRMAQPTTTEVK